MNWIDRKLGRIKSNKYDISSLSVDQSSYLTSAKDWFVAMCRSSQDAKAVWLLKGWVEFYKRGNWLLSNFTWGFTKRPVREQFREMEQIEVDKNFVIDI